MAENKEKAARAAKTKGKPASGWTIRGVSKETRAAVARAAKEDGLPLGRWVDGALAEAAKARDGGGQVSSALKGLKSRAEPTLDQLRSRTDETLERWRTGLIEQLGSTLVSVQRLQKQLLGREDAEKDASAPVQETPAARGKAKDASARKAARPSAGKGKRRKPSDGPA